MPVVECSPPRLINCHGNMLNEEVKLLHVEMVINEHHQMGTGPWFWKYCHLLSYLKADLFLYSTTHTHVKQYVLQYVSCIPHTYTVQKPLNNWNQYKEPAPRYEMCPWFLGCKEQYTLIRKIQIGCCTWHLLQLGFSYSMSSYTQC